MPAAGRAYISRQVSGRDAEDFGHMRAIEDAIVAAFGERVYYHVTRLDTVERIENELLPAERILELSEGVLPVMLVSFTYRTEEFGPADFAPLESRFALLMVGETIDSDE